MHAGQRVLVIEGDYAGELATITPNEEGRWEDLDMEDEAVWLHFDRSGQMLENGAILDDMWVPIPEVTPISK